MKKQFLAITFLLLISIAFSTVNAQEKSTIQIENLIKNKGKYAFLVQNSRHFIAALETGIRFKTKSKKIKFEIVLVGSAIKDLTTNKELKPYVDKAKELDIKIVICENSMAHLGVKKSTLPPSVVTTSYGFTYFLGLQERGYKTIQL